MLDVKLGAILGFAILALVASPADAQRKREGYEFLEAVRDRDGTKASELLDEPGSVLVNARDITSGETGLHIATQRRDPTWVRFLLQKGANPNIETRDGVSPLEIAVQLGFIEGVELLLKHGAQVDTTNIAGETPLISAVHRRDVEMIRALIAKGANPERADNSGRTARDYAELMGARSRVLDEIERAIAERGEKSKDYGPN
ncbi:ankyrin repeat domain-containing protein [Erythrobacter mangrovi]|uniref:ankyrin repeat domain-containing protein n=1 Tax=Erythrobacter mangrovi TaxID=2739433 RepID=UPI001F297190|nr:ankyrin repeat domain-containing protein [Erythrobacter mangrovi]